MKLLLFSDLHTNKAAADAIVRQAQAVDVLIGAGDFANVRTNLHACIDILRAVDRPTILVAGNNESTDELRDACRGWSAVEILHGTSVTIGEIPFFGIGGGIPVTPFGAWSYDFSEDEARTLLADCPNGCVLVTHSPPKGAVDRSSSGASLGSTAIRETIERAHPLLVVCGHIHESGGQQGWIDTTPVVNAGPRAREWDIETPAQP
ncbi:MAG: serine/threonine protein phosphatase [Chloroflexi bacterium]|nr:serine/threonine protein phosphatase [Chloroflexota bacterium]